MNLNKIKKSGGFTLIELLIVIAIIAVLAAAVIMTVTPGERITEARDATRASHMSAIGTACHLAIVDGEIDSLNECASGNGVGKFTNDEAIEVGLASAPTDPQNNNWFYSVSTTGGRIAIRPTTVSDTVNHTDWTIY